MDNLEDYAAKARFIVWTALAALAVVAVVVLSAPADAKSLGERLRTLPDEEYAFVGTRIADCGLTQYLLSSGKGIERNPILGQRPSSLKLWGFCTATALAHMGFVSYLQDNDSETARSAARWSFVLGAGIVGWNLKVALGK